MLLPALDSHIQAPSLAELRSHRSTKWRDFPEDVLPLPVAEMDFPVAEPIRQLLLEMVRSSDLGYLGEIPELPQAFAEHARSRMNWEVDPSQVHVVTDVGVGVVEVLRLITVPGDRILINSPVYHNFSTWIAEVGLSKVDLPFEHDEKGWHLDFSQIENAYRSGIKVHLLCNPHNPLGRLYSRAELLQIAELAAQYSVVVISDEIHGPLTFSESAFVPFLALGQTAQSVGIVVTAASKAWNIAGLKCALVISDGPVMNAVLQRLPIATHYRASLLGGFAAATAFSACSQWLDSVVSTLDFNRHFLFDLLQAKLPEVKYQVPENSYLAWLDLSALNLGDNPAEVMLQRGKVAILDGRGFGPSGQGFARLNFATSPEILTEAVERMARAIS